MIQIRVEVARDAAHLQSDVEVPRRPVPRARLAAAAASASILEDERHPGSLLARCRRQCSRPARAGAAKQRCCPETVADTPRARQRRTWLDGERSARHQARPTGSCAARGSAALDSGPRGVRDRLQLGSKVSGRESARALKLHDGSVGNAGHLVVLGAREMLAGCQLDGQAMPMRVRAAFLQPVSCANNAARANISSRRAGFDA